jgi:hypothetical protein
MGLFNRKKKEAEATKPNPITIIINNIKHVIEDSLFIKVQSSADDVSVYGWSLEMRSKYNGSWSTWHTYYNSKIYVSKESALDAAIKVGGGRSEHHEYRVTPLYIMTNPQYRDYKIDRLLGKEVIKNTYEIKGWKLKEDYEWYRHDPTNHVIVHKKGTIYIQLENGDIVKSGSYVDYTHRVGRDKLFSKLIPEGLVEEVKIEDEKWLHPHLLKELRVKLKIK